MARAARKTAAAKVDGQYAEGEGFEIGQRAPSTKYVDVDGKVSDEQPKDGGWVAVQAGDTVTPAIYDRLNPKSDDAADDSADDGADDDS